MRLSDQPRRPSASTSCLLSSLKTLPIPAQEHLSRAFVNVSAAQLLMAGFGVSINGRIWVSTEGNGRDAQSRYQTQFRSPRARNASAAPVTLAP